MGSTLHYKRVQVAVVCVVLVNVIIVAANTDHISVNNVLLWVILDLIFILVYLLELLVILTFID